MLIAESQETKLVKLRARNLDFSYGEKKALDGISMDIFAERATAIIGPSGCGKSTFLKCFNRIHEVRPAKKMPAK